MITKPTYIIGSNTKLGHNVQIDDFAILGYGGKDKLTIGNNAHIRSHSVIYHGSQIGISFQTGLGISVREYCKIGNNVSLGTHSVLEHHVTIGDNVRLHSNVFVPELTIIEKNAWIGPNVVFTNAHVPLCKNAPDCFQGVIVKQGAKIGANATLLPGIVIGKNALVGAGSVVTHNVPPSTVVAGNPSHAINKVANLRCPLDR